jgi:hypothetical protein
MGSMWDVKIALILIASLNFKLSFYRDGDNLKYIAACSD